MPSAQPGVTTDPGFAFVPALPDQRHARSKVDCEITTDEVDPSLAVPIEVPHGGLMVFHGLLPHETPAKRSSLRRRALQFRCRSAATGIVPREEHGRRFVAPDRAFVGCDYSRLETID